MMLMYVQIYLMSEITRLYPILLTTVSGIQYYGSVIRVLYCNDLGFITGRLGTTAVMLYTCCPFYVVRDANANCLLT